MAAYISITPGSVPAVTPEARPLRGRRHVLGDAIAGLAGAVILAGAGVAMATPETPASTPDAELMALAHEFCRLECVACRIINTAAATMEDEKEAERQAEPFKDQQHELAERIVTLRATTLDGMKAKARCAVMFGASSYDADLPYMGDQILSSLLTDLVGFPITDGQQGEREMRRRFEAGEVA